jgi:hypothetical protein
MRIHYIRSLQVFTSKTEIRLIKLAPHTSYGMPDPMTLLILVTEINGRGDLLRQPHDTLYPQKLTLTSTTSGGRSVGIIRLRITGHGVFSCLLFVANIANKVMYASNTTLWKYIDQTEIILHVHRFFEPRLQMEVTE